MRRSRIAGRAGVLRALLFFASSLPLLVLATTAEPATLVVAGSSTLAPLMVDIGRRFESTTAGVEIEVRTIGSGAGVAELRGGRCDIAMISRPVNESERDLYAFPIARDGAALVVNRGNPVRNLDSRQLADVLTGRIRDWKQLGGRAAPIRVAWRTEGQGVPDLLLAQLKLRSDQIRSDVSFFDNADAIRYAADHPDAIAFAALGVAERLAKSGMRVKLLSYEGIQASNRTLRDHTYALARPLILLSRNVPAGLQKRLIDLATSKAVADLDEKHGFVRYGE